MIRAKNFTKWRLAFSPMKRFSSALFEPRVLLFSQQHTCHHNSHKQIIRITEGAKFSNATSKKRRGLTWAEIGLIVVVVGGLSFELFSYFRSESRQPTQQHQHQYQQEEHQLHDDSVAAKLSNAWMKLVRKFKDTPMALSFIAANTAIFLLCKARPSLLPRLALSIEHTYNGRKWFTLLSSAFLHSEWWHFGLNMYVLYTFKTLEFELGSGPFALLYLASGMSSSLLSLLVKIWRSALSISLGASGCIYGIMVAYALEHPDHQFSIVFLPFFSFSAASAVTVILALDLFGLFSKRFRLFDHAGHLGGALAGFLCWLALRQFYSGAMVPRRDTYTRYNETYEGELVGFKTREGMGDWNINGMRYRGNFKNGKPHGMGEQWSKTVYVHGEFKEGKFVRGKMIGPNFVAEGEFLHAQLTRGMLIVNNEVKMMGTFNMNRELHGPNCELFWLKKGIVYRGNVENGKLKGEGQLSRVDGWTFKSDSFTGNNKDVIRGQCVNPKGDAVDCIITIHEWLR